MPVGRGGFTVWASVESSLSVGRSVACVPGCPRVGGSSLVVVVFELTDVDVVSVFAVEEEAPVFVVSVVRVGGAFCVVRWGAVISFLVVTTVVVRVGFVAVVRVGGSDLVVLVRGGGVGDDVVVMSVCLRVGG